jgi:hypothetical protein
MTNTEMLANDLRSTLEKFPGLNVIYKGDLPDKIRGNIVIKDEQGNYQGDYDVEIFIPEKYPHEFPQLFETSNKIERIDDRHINKWGEACLEIDIPQYFEAKRGISILRFTEHYVYKYLCGQIYYDYEKKWIENEWPHAGKGQYDFFSEYFNISDITIIIQMLIYVATKPKPIRTSYCICGSGKKYRQCHKIQIENLYGFDTKKMKRIIQSLIEMKKK